MNREQAIELLPVIQALAEGKEIQCCCKAKPEEDQWFDTDIIDCHAAFQYRVKEENGDVHLDEGIMADFHQRMEQEY